jgi:hypothetical protein
MSTVVLAELDGEAGHVRARGGAEFGCPAALLVAQFAVELRGLRGAAAEEPPPRSSTGPLCSVSVCALLLPALDDEAASAGDSKFEEMDGDAAHVSLLAAAHPSALPRPQPH